MTLHAWITVAVLVGTFAFLIRGTLVPALVVLGADVLLLALGILTPDQALSGFSNPAPFTVAALFIVARGVEKTGGLQPLLRHLLGGRTGQASSGWGGRVMDSLALVRLLGPVAAASAFLNNTPIVAMVAPQVEAWAERRGHSPARYLMPLSFAAILGGVVTAIGTSTTIVVSGLLQAAGHPPLGMFEISRLGLPLALAGILLLLLASPFLLPERRGALREFEEEYREYTVNMVVTRGGPLEGRTVESVGLRHLDGVFLVEIRREGEIIAPASPMTHLRGGDLLTFAGRSDLILDLDRIPGLTSDEEDHALEFHEAGHTYFEAVIGVQSPLNGRTLEDVGFRQEYSAAALALHRAGERLHVKLGEVPLRPGDTLILLAGDDFQALWRHRSDFLVISRLGGSPPTSSRQAVIVGGVLVGVVASAALGIMPILQGSLLGALTLVLSRVLTPAEAGAAVDLGVILLIASAFGVGEALQVTGLSSMLAEGVMAGVGGLGPRGALLGVILTTILLTELITNNAAAVLVFPIALATAGSLGLDPRPFAIAVAVGASASFLTPIGYQTNTMVYGPGGYRFGDFARLGAPLTLLVVVMTVWMVPFLWSF